MIPVANSRADGSEMVTTEVAIPYRRWKLTRRATVAEDTAAEMLPVSLSIMVRSDNQI